MNYTQDGPDSSVLKSLLSEVKQLRSELKSFKCGELSISAERAESNTMLNHEDYIPTDGPIQGEPLIVLNSWLHGKVAKVLKDDGCNTNVVSTQVLRNDRKLFKIAKVRSCANHSQKDTPEESVELIISGTLRLVTHVYKSNWVVASGRYEVLLGMPWHVAHNPRIDYVQRVVQVGGDEIPVDSFGDERV